MHALQATTSKMCKGQERTRPRDKAPQSRPSRAMRMCEDMRSAARGRRRQGAYGRGWGWRRARKDNVVNGGWVERGRARRMDMLQISGPRSKTRDARHEAHSNESKLQRSRGEIYNISKATKQGALLRGDLVREAAAERLMNVSVIRRQQRQRV